MLLRLEAIERCYFFLATAVGGLHNTYTPLALSITKTARVASLNRGKWLNLKQEKNRNTC